MKLQQSSAGFTLVELITVILILGILAATALPKFMNVTEQAHSAAVAGAAGGMGSAVALVHAQWMANGHTAAQANLVNFGDDDIDTNSDGWPVDTAGAATLTTAVHCTNVWEGVMQNPPKIPEDYTVAAPVAGECTYTYVDNTAHTITYDSTNGEVDYTN